MCLLPVGCQTVINVMICNVITLILFHFLKQREHFAIRERKRPEDPIECNDLKSMRFTRAVRSLYLSLTFVQFDY